MRKVILVILVVGFCTVGAFAATTTSHTASATLTLSGTIPAYVNITATPTRSLTTLPLDQPESSMQIANITEYSNESYTVTLTSANGGVFKSNTATNLKTLPYKVQYGTATSAAVQPSSSGTVVTTAGSNTGSTGTPNGLYLTYSSGKYLPPDTYSDTLTFTITGP